MIPHDADGQRYFSVYGRVALLGARADQLRRPLIHKAQWIRRRLAQFGGQLVYLLFKFDEAQLASHGGTIEASELLVALAKLFGLLLSYFLRLLACSDVTDEHADGFSATVLRRNGTNPRQEPARDVINVERVFDIFRLAASQHPLECRQKRSHEFFAQDLRGMTANCFVGGPGQQIFIVGPDVEKNTLVVEFENNIVERRHQRAHLARALVQRLLASFALGYVVE